MCNARKHPKSVAPTVLTVEKQFELKCIVVINTFLWTQKKVCHVRFNAV